MKPLRLKGGPPVRAQPLRPWPTFEQGDLDELAALVCQGAWSMRQPGKGGQYKKRLETAFARLAGTSHAVAVCSGTTALDLAVDALELEPGGVVVAANYGHPATVRRAAEHHELALVDVASDNLCLDPAQVQAALDRHPVRAILATHVAGHPGAIIELAGIADRAGVPLIEDASHAHGAQVAGRPVGSIGQVACFSLHATKNLAAGEGGLLTTGSASLLQRLWRAHDLGRDAKDGPYDFRTAGGSYRLAEVPAFLALRQLDRLAEHNRRCMAAVNVLRSHWRDAPVELLAHDDSVEVHPHHVLIARYRPERCQGLSRKRFILAMCAEGIPCNSGWPRPLSALPFLAPRCRPHATPVTEDAITSTVWFDRRLLLVAGGVEQLVEAVDKVAAQAHLLRSRR